MRRRCKRRGTRSRRSSDRYLNRKRNRRQTNMTPRILNLLIIIELGNRTQLQHKFTSIIKPWNLEMKMPCRFSKWIRTFIIQVIWLIQWWVDSWSIPLINSWSNFTFFLRELASQLCQSPTPCSGEWWSLGKCSFSLRHIWDKCFWYLKSNWWRIWKKSG